MDIPALFQRFESSLSTYTGDDPLNHWNRFIEYLGKRGAPDDPSGLSFVLERLMERFLHDERYANDVRFVNHCIKLASYYTEPIAMYAHIYSKGVGTRAAPLYLAWAQQFEKIGALEQADAVYQRAVENQAQPADAVLHEYSQFQMRMSKTQTPLPATSRLPLQTSQLVNQMPPQKEAALHCEGPSLCSDLLPVDKTIRIIARSENLGVRTSNAPGAGTQTVSAYHKEPLHCEGSELTFEEVRAARYFLKIHEEGKRREFEVQKRLAQEKEEKVLKLKHCLEALDHELGGLQGDPMAPLQVKQRPPCHTPLATIPPAGWSVFSVKDPHPSTSAHPAAPRASLAGAWAPLAEAQPVRPCLPCFPPTSNRNFLYGHRQADSGATSFVPPDHPSASVQRQQEAPERELPEDQPAEAEPRLDISQGATASFSHITPNTSLGQVCATPSRVLPSPTVNTREALNVIMDMFQAPTLLDDPFNNTVLGNADNRSADAIFSRNGPASFAEPAPPRTPATMFTIYQDDAEQENPRVSASVCGAEKPKAARALAGIPALSSDRPSEGNAEAAPDESTMWGVRYNSLNSLAACPNSTRDFEPLAQLVSTPFTSKAPYIVHSYQDQENNCQSALGDEGNGFGRQPKKLSPIIEQSPPEETFSDQAGGPKRTRGGPAQHGGTIMGEALSLGPHSGLTTSCTTVVHPPPGALSFRDHTLVQAAKSPPRAPAAATATTVAATSAWSIFTSPVPSPKPDPAPPQPEAQEGDPRTQSSTTTSSFRIGSFADQGGAFDVPMSPECGPEPDWLVFQSPEPVTKPDLDAFVSPPRAPAAPLAGGQNKYNLPMTPDAACGSVSDVSMMSPAVEHLTPSADDDDDDNEPMSPDRGTAPADVPMSPLVLGPAGGGHRVADPWDEDLIAGLLSGLSPPLSSHPHCIPWQCNIPNISPKITITMGQASLRVDCLLGEGAFAKVYQASDPMTSEKMVIKVQKPSNPWEFYINTQLDGRLPPAVRHLYSNIQSAHLFHNGSILLAELHRCGTLLNAVNLYKKLSDKVMPQLLVMYFTACMLHMVEQLHRGRLVHGDIKPDNFLFGERFLESQCLDPDMMEHGMVLVDMGQSIDMDLFPEGTEFTARCMTSGFQCTEMLSGRPWSYQTDYFGMAGTVYCMLFGTYMQVKQEDGVWKTNAMFRRNPHSELWLELFHTLLNIQDGLSLPCLRSLRCRLCTVLRETYGSKLLSLKNRLVVLLLENMRTARR